jgi:hypothetical protein
MGVFKGKGAMPMRSRLVLFSALVFLAAYGSALGAEPGNSVLVAAPLRPVPAFTLTAPSTFAIEAPAFEAFSVPSASNFQFPRPFPSLVPSPNTGKALFDANLALMIGLNIADYLSTKEALKYPGLEETNPLMKPFVKSPVAFAAIKAGTTALSYWSMKSVFKKNRTMAWIMTTASNVVISCVVFNNMRLVHKARTR